MKFAVIWILFNLIFSNFITPLLPENSLRFIFGMWMPALTAILLLKVEKKSILVGINWGFGHLKAFRYAILIPVLIAFITVLTGLMTGHLSFSGLHTFPILGSLLTLVVWIIASLGEEIGWRGYLHNHLQRIKHFPFLIGIIWGAWHLRDLLSLGSNSVALFSFFSLTILLSYFLAWLIEIGGTVIACGLFHGVWNFLRLKLLFGNPTHGTSGFFITSNSQLTEMEGIFGVLTSLLVITPFIISWYRKRQMV